MELYEFNLCFRDLPKHTTERWFQVRHVKQLDTQLQKLDGQYDACNEVMVKGEVNGFTEAFLTWMILIDINLFYIFWIAEIQHSDQNVLYMHWPIIIQGLLLKLRQPWKLLLMRRVPRSYKRWLSLDYPPFKPSYTLSGAQQPAQWRWRQGAPTWDKKRLSFTWCLSGPATPGMRRSTRRRTPVVLLRKTGQRRKTRKRRKGTTLRNILRNLRSGGIQRIPPLMRKRPQRPKRPKRLSSFHSRVWLLCNPFCYFDCGKSVGNAGQLKNCPAIEPAGEWPNWDPYISKNPSIFYQTAKCVGSSCWISYTQLLHHPSIH